MTTRCTILIVEDELITRQALKYIIEQQSSCFQVIGEACNGLEAQELIKMHKPHIVISDIVMPIINGIDLIKWIQFQYPEIKVIVLSSHNDFDYIKSAFQYGIADYILKPTLEPSTLLSILHKISSTLLIKEDASFPTATYPYQHFYLLGITLNKVVHPLLCRELFFEKLKEAFSGLQYTITEVSGQNLIILLNFNKEDKLAFHEAIIHLSIELFNCGHSLRLGCSPSFNDALLKEKYLQDLEKILTHQFFSSPNQLPLITSFKSHACQSDFNQIDYSRLLRSGSYDEGLCLLLTFIRQIDDSYTESESELKVLLQNIIYNTFTIFKELQLDFSTCPLNRIEIIQAIHDTCYLCDLKAYFEGFYKEISHWLYETQSMDKFMLRQIQKYILEHYHEPITLNTLSHTFHLSYSYLSAYFNEASPQSFNEFLNEIRINKAKEFLTHTQLSILEISERVGYTDQSYFSKVFKKTTGFSPSQYKKLNLDEGV